MTSFLTNGNKKGQSTSLRKPSVIIYRATAYIRECELWVVQNSLSLILLYGIWVFSVGFFVVEEDLRGLVVPSRLLLALRDGEVVLDACSTSSAIKEVADAHRHHESGGDHHADDRAGGIDTASGGTRAGRCTSSAFIRSGGEKVLSATAPPLVLPVTILSLKGAW
jgi:hypothetical protein